MPEVAAGAGARSLSLLTERRLAGEPALYVQPEWQARFPWLVQGTTEGRTDGRVWDFGLAGDVAVGTALGRWRSLMAGVGFGAAVHARQVHGSAVDWHDSTKAGLLIGDGLDGQLTASPGLLLTISIADCVPVFLLQPHLPAVGVVHAGWRGIAAGVLERGIQRLTGETASDVGQLLVHLGPAICGRCYEVGPEVPEALGLPPRMGPSHVDLRAVLAERAAAAGVAPGNITCSSFCTRCGASPFLSHRGGDRGRQLGLIGIRPPEGQKSLP